MIKYKLSKGILLVEIIGILTVILFEWIDEKYDLPFKLFHIFGAPKTPFNMWEFIFETFIIFLLGILIVLVTIYLINKIKYLEELLHLCVFCKKVRINGDWLAIEKYLSENYEAEFSHGLCPECIEKYYGELLGPKKLKKIIDIIAKEKEIGTV